VGVRPVRIAVIGRQAGEREESQKAYDEFFTVWKDGDPDIPIPREAKAEYKKLTATPPTVTATTGK
jgi:hypothetical protein